MMNRVEQMLDLVRAERRDVEAGMRERFDARRSVQLDKLIAVEDLLNDYQRQHD